MIRALAAEKQCRLDELAARATLGLLTPAEQQERELLVAEAEALMVQNAKALVRHRYPERYAAADAVARRALRRLRRRRTTAAVPPPAAGGP